MPKTITLPEDLVERIYEALSINSRELAHELEPYLASEEEEGEILPEIDGPKSGSVQWEDLPVLNLEAFGRKHFGK